MESRTPDPTRHDAAAGGPTGPLRQIAQVASVAEAGYLVSLLAEAGVVAVASPLDRLMRSAVRGVSRT